MEGLVLVLRKAHIPGIMPQGCSKTQASEGFGFSSVSFRAPTASQEMLVSLEGDNPSRSAQSGPRLESSSVVFVCLRLDGDRVSSSSKSSKAKAKRKTPLPLPWGCPCLLVFRLHFC